MSFPAKAVLFSSVVVASFLAGGWWTRRGSDERKPAASARTILYYRCPMHPQLKSDRPGDAPCCGMRLEPVYEGEEQAASLPPGAFKVSLDRQQIMGVRTGEVAKAAGAETVVVSGRVVTDEDRLYRILTATDGWIQQVASAPTGSVVQKDQLLGSFYNREFASAQQAYFFALDTMDRLNLKSGHAAESVLEASSPAQGPVQRQRVRMPRVQVEQVSDANGPSPQQLALTNTQIQNSTDNLQSLGMSRLQIEQLGRTRTVTRMIEIRAPAAGIVLARNIAPSQRFDRGTELFRIAELSRVWVLSDVLDRDAHFVRPGMTAQVVLPGQSASLPATVSPDPPQFDPASRTYRFRLVAENPRFSLRPDMIVQVRFPARLPSGLFVPVDAVLDSGLKKTVFVDLGSGYFEPRKVETGLRTGDRVQILKGLAAGERIVLAGNFLLDSETRMRSALPDAPQPAPAKLVKDPVCGMELNPKDAASTTEYKSSTYFFCSKSCKEKFDRASADYVPPRPGG